MIWLSNASTKIIGGRSDSDTRCKPLDLTPLSQSSKIEEEGRIKMFSATESAEFPFLCQSPSLRLGGPLVVGQSAQSLF